MKQTLKSGTTSKRLVVFIADSSSTSGGGLTGLAYNSPGLKWSYWREDSGNNGGTAITPVTATRGSWVSGGLKEIDSTNLPGWYELGIPNAVLAAGAGWVVMHLWGGTNMVPVPFEVQLVSYDPSDGNGLGLGRLDATVSSRLAATDYVVPPTVSAVRTELDTNSSRLANLDVAVSSRLAGVNFVSYSPEAIDAVLTSSHGSGSWLQNDLSDVARESTLEGIQSQTARIPEVPAAVGSAMGLVTNAITAETIQNGTLTDAKFALPTVVAGPATGALSRLDQLWRYFFGKVSLSEGALTLFGNDGVSVLTTQTVADDGTTQTRGAAT